MAQPTVRNKKYGYDNIAAGQVYGLENAVAVGVPKPAENIELSQPGGQTLTWNREKNAPGVTNPDPERLGP